jgi:molecular chaperone GrpE
MENTVQPEQEVEIKENSAESIEPQAEAINQSLEANLAPNQELKKLQDELAEAKDKYLRLYAEFENHRRRTAKEKIELIQSGGEQILKALLPVADDFDRAEKSYKEKSDKELEGFFLIQNKFKKILEQQSVKEMDMTSKEFNPDLHEAITQAAAPSGSLKGKIIDVLEKGYMLNEKVMRHAKVVIGA